MEQRKNILMDVSVAPQPRVPTPPPPEPVPTEKDIFKKKSVESVAQMDTIPEIAEPVAPVKKKRACSDKMKAHLANCREKARQKKEAMKASKQVTQAPPSQAPPRQVSEPIPIPQAQPAGSPHGQPVARQPAGVDYDRIINGVSNRLQKQKQEDKWIQDYEMKIREEERAKAKKEYGNYFMEAATKFKKKTYAGYGRQAIYGNPRELNHPVFGNKRSYQKDMANPYDDCFN